MFTGIIKRTGDIKNMIEDSIIVKMRTKDINKGDSIAINGICLTAVDIHKDSIKFEISKKTKDITNLKFVKKVNIEVPLRPSDFFSGHFVTGHIDGMVKLVKVEDNKRFKKFYLNFPAEFSRFITLNGSVALDGVSLTIEGLNNETFSVNIIPETLKRTNLSEKKEGDLLNFEADVMARYLVNFIEAKEKSNKGLTKEKLEKWL